MLYMIFLDVEVGLIYFRGGKGEFEELFYGLVY